MTSASNELELLARRVQQGDYQAASELRRRLGQSLGPIIRRALRGVANGSALAGQIRTLSQRAVSPEAADEGPSSGLVGRVADAVCGRVLGRLRRGADSLPVTPETVAV